MSGEAGGAFNDGALWQARLFRLARGDICLYTFLLGR